MSNLNQSSQNSNRILHTILDSGEKGIYELQSQSAGPRGIVPVSAEMLRQEPSGNLFAFSQNAGMGWTPAELG
ncbi:MAG TPA: hypothetical protein VMW38_08905, partial [Terriglobia bacterium]|nr:hypothetical protein [Terriglobia bacterium]